jgi:hypothetical protein
VFALGTHNAVSFAPREPLCSPAYQVTYYLSFHIERTGAPPQNFADTSHKAVTAELTVRGRGIWAVCLCVWVCGQVSMLTVFLHTGPGKGSSPLWAIQIPYVHLPLVTRRMFVYSGKSRTICRIIKGSCMGGTTASVF